MEEIRLSNSKAISEKIKQLAVVNYETVSELIPGLLAKGELILNPLAYIPKDPNTTECFGIGRYLIYDNPDEHNPFSIWAFAFAKGQKTPIHSHKDKGTVTVVEGIVSENYYQPNSDEHTARLISRLDRERFHTNHDDLNDEFVHQLKRKKCFGEGISVSLHIYNMSAYLVNDKGEQIENRNLGKIYTKYKLFDKSILSEVEKSSGELTSSSSICG